MKDFIKFSRGCYKFIKNNKMEHLFDKLHWYRNNESLEELLDELYKNNYKTKYELRKLNPGLFSKLKSRLGLPKLGELINNKYRGQ